MERPLELPAKIFVYEHICGGGLAGEPLPPSLRAEGWAMLQAVVEDLAALRWVEVVSMLDARLDGAALPVPILRAGDRDSARAIFEELAAIADGVLVIAPELGGALAACSRAIVSAGGRHLGPDQESLELAADKLALAEHLGRYGIPAVPAEPCAPGQTWDRPMVVKPRLGCGSLDITLVAPGAPAPEIADAIATPLVPGQAASVLAIIGDGGSVLCAPCAQELSQDGRFRYLGGGAPLAPDLSDRAGRLARRALEALPGLRGFAGVDLVLGRSGEEDRVVEINPRLTTSYVGLRRLALSNLAGSWLDAWCGGEPAPPRWRPGSVSFTPDGEWRRGSKRDAGAGAKHP
jgi:predicted ATP-grasp superfamily ATP-dependent carboligase